MKCAINKSIWQTQVINRLQFSKQLNVLGMGSGQQANLDRVAALETLLAEPAIVAPDVAAVRDRQTALVEIVQLLDRLEVSAAAAEHVGAD